MGFGNAENTKAKPPKKRPGKVNSHHSSVILSKTPLYPAGSRQVMARVAAAIALPVATGILKWCLRTFLRNLQEKQIQLWKILAVLINH